MFHHFHGGKHIKSQGSLNAQNFEQMIDWLNERYRILDAYDYLESYLSNNLKNNDICLSFDDGLKCQFDIAFPVLQKKGITAFFFVYSSVFTDKPDFLEIYRLFRTKMYASMDDFYNEFFSLLKKRNEAKYNELFKIFNSINYFHEFPFYTKNDKWFRFLRDKYLSKIRYSNIMKKLMLSKGFNYKNESKNLWMNEENIKLLNKEGHVIGLHSHSHPTQITKLSYSNQKNEYKYNLKYLQKILNCKIEAVSHPCGDYNEKTLEILERLGVKIGFRSNLAIKVIKSSLEIPREDHSNVLNEMKNENNSI